MNRSAGLLLALLFLVQPAVAAQPRPGSGGPPDSPDRVNPIDALESVWIGDLTWIETRDAISAGKTTAIIPTGAGSEQNGPYLAGRKHDIIIKATAESIARRLGNALVAPIVSFVPEGDWDVPFGTQRYPGTIGVSDATFEAILTDVATSLRAMGIQTIIFIGDSGGNQAPAERVATALNARWTDGKTKVYHIGEYYNWPQRQQWLRDHGINETMQAIGLHDEFSAAAIMLMMEPTTVRIDQRKRVGQWSINGVDLAPEARTVALARELVEWITDVTVDAFYAKSGTRATDRRD
ncbi:MAG: creatininase family protein [Chloroflexi bacterium]|nr:creatininase family protein [Chloroflexota bacterium]